MRSKHSKDFSGTGSRRPKGFDVLIFEDKGIWPVLSLLALCSFEVKKQELNTAIRHIIARTYKPMLVKYLSRQRVYRYKNIRLDIPPEVFHPAFFFSTRLLLQYLGKLSLNNKRFLEPGCGSGLIAIAAAKKGAIVTASDINPIATEYLEKNSKANHVDIEIIHSDLFQNIPPQQFDIIAINPPYYKKQPVTAKDHAWFCGANGEFFAGLFGHIAEYMHAGTGVFMVLFDGCDLEMINRFAAKNDLSLVLVHSKRNLLERNFIFKIEKKS